MLTWTTIEFEKCSASTLRNHSQRDEHAIVEHNNDQCGAVPKYRVCEGGDPEFPSYLAFNVRTA